MASLDPLALISDVEFHSNWTPDISVNPNGPSDPNSSADVIAAMKWLQPEFKINFISGVASPLTIAPWGTPGPSKWGSLQFGAQAVAIGSLALGIYSVISLILPRKR